MSSDEDSTDKIQQSPLPNAARTRKGGAFWCIFLSLCLAVFLAALELTAVSTALPTIAHDLRADDFVWIGSAYTLSSTALLPMSGGMAQIFGRRPALLICLGLFALGSGICGGASSMGMLIAGRTVQGLGGGGIQSLSFIVLADLTTLQERGIYTSLFGIVWCIAGVSGPVVGGSLAATGQWRWLFYLNLPICGVAGGLVLVFLKLPTPPGTFAEKFKRLDWVGNALVVGGTAACTIALSWGGVIAPWNSAKVLVPLIVGLGILGLFLLWEAKWATYPMVPYSLMSNRTSLSGYLQTFLITIVCLAVIYYMAVYFQGCKDASPVHSGVLAMGFAALSPTSIISGVAVAKMHRYRPQLWFGWCLAIIGFGIASTLGATDSTARVVGYEVVLGVGIGCGFTTVMFPVLAPLPAASNAQAIAFFQFIRSFAGVWGITIGGTVLQNELKRRIPADYLANFPEGAAIAYSLIPLIPTLPEPLKGEVQDAFAKSLQVLWKVMIGVAGVGFLSSLMMKGLPLHTDMDSKWAMNRRVEDDENMIHLVGKVQSAEKGQAVERATAVEYS
ncbi:MFS general substrate transporter [Polyporus arcularius HHB13444]|uniref:MFS general substrate transporter n=1 Tax=Polyporus arcularius HHB13444 TaxID=1314778 RepID=A0A5C3PHP2_9APHY|nr:MFS general substrate transporter [Polyporus arcularius HHB13444]